MNRLSLVVMAIVVSTLSSQAFGFDKIPIGQMKASEAAKLLESIGDKARANEVRNAVKAQKADAQLSTLWWGNKEPKAYEYTNHSFGFIPKGAPGATQLLDITEAGNISPDASLKNAAVKVTLDRLRVFEYPGKGVHQILFDFFGRHQATESGEDIHFSQIYRAQQGQGAGITGYPVFVGLKVGKEGINFRVRTVNVKNEDDEKLLTFMGSDPFKNGLQLLNASNPLAPVVTSFATGVVDAVAKRDRNIPVQEFYMGLDFSSGISTHAKISEGSYIVVQQPEIVWDWTKWAYSPATGQVVSKADPGKTIPFNYIVFSVSKMEN